MITLNMMADQLKFDKKIIKITNYVALNNAPLKKSGALSNATWFWSFDNFLSHSAFSLEIVPRKFTK